MALALLLVMDLNDRGPHFQSDRYAANVIPGALNASKHELSRLRILTRCVGYIRANYVDPERADARAMLFSALADVERKVPEFMVDAKNENGVIESVSVRIGKHTQDFSLARVNDLYTMSWKLIDIFKYISPHLGSTISGRDIEYAAISGMLRTLDPHSTLLTPSVYREMKLGTTGKFGGLGIVISQRDGKLIIQSVMERTPARTAGLKSGDIITQIGAESTINMSLNDAVNRLRGPAGTAVDLWINRKAFTEPVKFRVVRANITLASVTTQLLEGGLGYAKIKNFQQSTADDLKAAIERMTSERQRLSNLPLSGLILDVRDNPGGLLDQAINVSDLFLRDGTIVTTVGSGNKVREEKIASVRDTWSSIPLAVLVNKGSASASEIVAGALRNHDRAVIIGRQTFGKGSVQVIYDIDSAALKLTVAQYLTPGDESIQNIGITPHLELLPVVVTEGDIRLNSEDHRGERELENHLKNATTTAHIPAARLSYLQSASDDEDFAVELAKNVLLSSGNPSTKSVLEQVQPTLDGIRQREATRIVQALKTVGIDWMEGSNTRNPRLVAQLNVPQGPLTAGDNVRLELQVKNTGKDPAYRVRGRSVSSASAFDDLDFPIGLIPPGKTRTYVQTLKLARSMQTERVKVGVSLYADSAKTKLHNSREIHADVDIQALQRPRYGYSVRVLDHESGNGDGLINENETVTIRVQIHNIGSGASHRTLATLRNRGGQEVFITKGREWIESIAPGKSHFVDFKIKVQGPISPEVLEVDLQVTDSVLRQRMTHTLDLPTADSAGAPVILRPSQWVVQQDTSYQDSAHTMGITLGTYAKGTPLFSDARIGDWLRIPVQNWDYVWVKRANLLEAPPGVNIPQLAKSDTKIAITQPDIQLTEMPPLETNNPTIRIAGKASFSPVENEHPDVYIFRDNDKVYFQRAESIDSTVVDFTSDIELKPGRNVLSIYARAGRDLIYKSRLTVQRSP